MASNPIPKSTIYSTAIAIFATLIILSAILYLLYYLWYSLVRRSRTSPYDAVSPSNKLHRFTYKDLKDATHNFTPPNSIGRGGSGTVFKGILKDGKLVAVKLLDSISYQCELEFQNELKVLGALRPSPFIVSLLGFCVDKGKRLVVYEYMPNKSLQESLFFGNPSLNWDNRFGVILDVAKALAFLHLECDPPVIHGDVKPSNVLLDSEFRAKLSDFGLSRLKLEGDNIGVDLFSQELGKSQELLNDKSPTGTPLESNENDEVDFAMALQASSSSKNSCRVYNNVMGLGLAVNSLNFNFTSDKGKEFVPPFDEELSSLDHSKEFDLSSTTNDNANAKQWGKDWWWRQDGSGELCSKDYVMEWIGSQICPSNNTDWDEEKGVVHERATPLDKCVEVNEIKPAQDPGVRDLKGDSKKWKVHRKMHEWWKEDEQNETRKKRIRLRLWRRDRFKAPHFGLGKWFEFTRGKRDHKNCGTADQDGEFSFRKGWRKKNSRSMGSDMWSGDVFSRELSSTTSMRGTLCYVAPEYGGFGYLMEKADIYSLGVLMLVIVSGRRPLHVLSSPMKLEKANLVSWSRSLAHSGNVLELVDERLKEEYDKAQATLCINLALACLQKMPELRPDIGDVVKILTGEMELPDLPFEFSPSKLFNRSRRKHKSCE